MSKNLYADIPLSERPKKFLRALDTGDTDALRDLLELKVDPNLSWGGAESAVINKFLKPVRMTPVKFPALVVAAIQGNENAVRMLLAAGANVSGVLELSDGQKWDALACACEEIRHDVIHTPHEAIACMLVEHGIDTRSDALEYVPNNKPHMVEMLLDHPQKPEMLKLMLCRASAFYEKSYPDRDTALRITRRLLDMGVDVNCRSGNATPLLAASSGKVPELVALLIECGADLNMVNTDTKRSPLNIACRHGAAGCMEALLKAGAHLTNQDFNCALETRSDEKVLAMLQCLHQSGVDPRRLKVEVPLLKAATLLEAVVKQDLVQSAQFMFQVLGEDLWQKSSGNAPLVRICGPKTKALVLALRSEMAVGVAIGDPDPAEPQKALRSKNTMGIL